MIEVSSLASKPYTAAPQVSRASSEAPSPAPTAAGDTFDPSTPSSWTPLQKHAEFFDPNHDGVITVGETYKSLRSLGIGALQASAFAVAINAALGLKSGSSWTAPLQIRVAGINAGKHGSDTGVYTAKGQLDPDKFKAIFDLHDLNHDGCLNSDEAAAMIAANRTDAVGNRGSKAEFSLLMKLAGTEQTLPDGSSQRVLTRETMEHVYDGSLFFRLAGNQPTPW